MNMFYSQKLCTFASINLKIGMKKLLSALLLPLLMVSCTSFFESEEDDVMSVKTIKSYEEKFSISMRSQANTAANASYLTQTEKEVFYYLNLARLNPRLFAQTFVTDYYHAPGYSAGYAFTERKQSLIETLSTMQPLEALIPNEMLFEFAECFATGSGKLGIVGHDRSQTGCITPNQGWFAECCDYGNYDSGLWVVLELLIDSGENNAALGHRKIMLDGSYLCMGVAVRPHTGYGKVTVLDFWSEYNMNYYLRDTSEK